MGEDGDWSSIHVVQAQEGVHIGYFNGMFCLPKDQCVSVVDLEINWFDDVSQVLYACCEPLALFRFELNSGSAEGCGHLFHTF